MAIQVRRGALINLDRNQLLPGEFGVTTDTGILVFCYSAGNVRTLATAEDIQAVLDVSPNAYTALQALITDLNNNPSELTNILNNITALQLAVENISTDAIDTTYDNSVSGLKADNVQDAIDETKKEISQISINAKSGGAFGDGLSHPLSSKFATLELAQSVYPCAIALTDEIDWCAITTAISYGVITGNKVFIPSGTYITNRKLTLPDGSKVYGAGMDDTIIKGTVSGNAVIELTTVEPRPYFVHELCDIQIMGDATVSAGGVSTGGLLISGAVHPKIERVKTCWFASGAYASVGNPSTELKYGIRVAGTVGVVIEDCYMAYNDVGNIVDKGIQSVNTTTLFKNCTASLNRTHALKWSDTMTTKWENGIMESNAGLVTALIESTQPNEYGNVIGGGVHMEDNHRLTTVVVGDGTREIKVNGYAGASPKFDTIFFGSGTDYCIELSNTKDAVISNCKTGGFKSFLFNSTAVDTNIENGQILNAWTDNGVGTKSNGDMNIVKDDADVTGNSPNVFNKSYVKVGAVTITDLLGGMPGQIITLVGQYGSILSGADKFSLLNGSTFLHIGAGNTIELRKHAASGKWVATGKVSYSAKSTLTNADGQYLDMRNIWNVGDANTTAISILNGGYDGQEITLMSKHTGANTTLFTDGTGNLKLAGNYTMAIGGILTLVYDLSTDKWYEKSRSANG